MLAAAARRHGDHVPEALPPARRRVRRGTGRANRARRAGVLVAANTSARGTSSAFRPRDIGPPAPGSGGVVSARRARGALDRALSERREVTLKDVALVRRAGDTRYYDVQVAPLFDDDARP